MIQLPIYIYASGKDVQIFYFLYPMIKTATVADLVNKLQSVAKDHSLKRFLTASNFQILQDTCLIVDVVEKYGTEFALVDDKALEEDTIANLFNKFTKSKLRRQ